VLKSGDYTHSADHSYFGCITGNTEVKKTETGGVVPRDRLGIEPVEGFSFWKALSRIQQSFGLLAQGTLYNYTRVNSGGTP
jgi:hypothetical protein